jgi:hypothetical protein
VAGTPPNVNTDSPTLQALTKGGVVTQAQADAFTKAIGSPVGLSNAQRQQLLGLLVGDAAKHEPVNQQLTQAELDQLFDFVRTNVRLFKELPQPPPSFDLELRIKDIKRVLATLGASYAIPPNLNAFGSAASGALSQSDRDLLADYKAKYGAPSDWGGEPDPNQQLTGTHKFRLAFGISLRWIPSGAAAELEAMLKDPWFWGGIAVGIGAYFALWAVPEPVISKSLAAGITIGLLAIWGASEIWSIAKAWLELATDCDTAISLADIEAAAEKFGKAMGATGARILVTLALMIVGGKLLPKKLPPPPGSAVAVQSLLWGAPGSGAALQTVPVLVVDWDVAAAQAAWAIKVLSSGTVVIVASGTVTHAAMMSGAGSAGPPRAKGVAKPSGPKGGTPTGTPDPIGPNDDAPTVRGRQAERKAAQVLADSGYPTEQRPTVNYPKKPDLRVSGYVFDVYSPDSGTPVENIWSKLLGKLTSGQARRFVVYLDDWIVGKGASRLDLTSQLYKSAKQTPGVEQILLVLRGSVFEVYP